MTCAKILRQNILLSVLSLVLFFGAGEIVVRFFAGSPLITEPDNVLFWKYKKNQTGHQKLYSPVSRVDKFGFRSTGSDFNPAFPSIYCGGDSYTWGEGVLDSETFSGQLLEILKSRGLNYNVLNGGVPGYGVEQILNRMKIECERYNPEYAILLWFERDINRMRNISEQEKERFLKDYRIRSMFRYSAFSKWLKENIFDKLLHKELGFGCYTDKNIEYENTHPFSERIEGLTPIIKENTRFLKSKGITPVWVFMTVPTKEFRDYIVSLANELSVTLIDPEPAYRYNFPGLENMATEHSGHFKPKVYRILAEEAFSKLNIIPKQ
ncbi:MAG: SGNH/GDSL hydrolase family protein [Candidatus Omnitrophota bacterium]|nr:SGNH/GDSL hydrolase family protein [Candidatus Omnitrophota bacterium]